MAVRNAGATGACGVFRDIEEMDYELIIEGEVDEVGPKPSDNE